MKYNTKLMVCLGLFILSCSFVFAAINPISPDVKQSMDSSPVQVVAGKTIGQGQVTVSSAGTRVHLNASPTTVISVTIKANKTNTGLIYIGNTAVSAANGYILSPGDSVSVDIWNLQSIWVDAATSGDGVSYLSLAQV